uniref:CSON005387 protein n=1 Tax=Culicoides sonorensis TaxID=179676 RepID=A0A336MRB7_CULSO
MLDIRPISPELAAIAQNECFEVPERMEEDVKTLRYWIEKSPYIRANLTDQGLVSILRASKYSLEKAKKKIDVGLTVRTLMPEMFTNLYPITDQMKEILDLGIQCPLPLAAPDAPRVLLNRDGLNDPQKHNIYDIMKVNAMCGDLLFSTCDNFAISGFAAVIDQQFITFDHIKQMNPTFIKKMAYAFQEGSPYRIKGLHFINFSPWIVKIFNFFKMFLNEKTKSRIYVHESLEELYKYVPRKILPSEYGGEAGPVDVLVKEFNKFVLENEEFFKAQQMLGTDEKKRPGKPKTSESVFGLEGSFRQLEFD